MYCHDRLQKSDAVSGGTPALEKALAGEELSYNDGVQLMNEENLFLLGAAADRRRQEICGNVVTFVASYYLNYTNVCAASCPLCAFYRKGSEDDAYTLSTDQIVGRAQIAIEQMGSTELHIVGGFHPKLGLEYYENMMKTIKAKYPKVMIKALTPAEIFFIARLTKNSVKEVLSRLKSAGLDALPGGALNRLILLTPPSPLAAATRSWLQARPDVGGVAVLGGTAAVAESTVDAIRSAVGG